MLRPLAFLLFTLATLLPTAAGAQEPTAPEGEPQAETLEIVEITADLSVVYGRSGYGSNVGVLVSEEGLLLIDTANGRHPEALDAAVRSISKAPVRAVLNTHADRDHTGSNALWAERGAKIYAHETFRYTSALSHVRFDDRLTIDFGDETITARAVAAHAPSDLLIHLPRANALFLGDAFTNRWHPTFNFGGLEGQLEMIDRALELADEETRIVPGHGSVTDRARLLRYRADCIEWVERVGELHKSGARVEQMLVDATLNQLRDRFVDQEFERKIPDDRFRRFVERTISAEFVQRIPLAVLDLSLLTGRYEFSDGDEKGTTIVISERDGRLFASREGAFLVELVPVSQNRFHLRGWIDDYVEFERNGERHATGLVHTHGFEATRRARRVSDHPPSSAVR